MLSKEDIEILKLKLPEYLYAKHNITDLKRNFRCLNPDHEDKHPSMSYTPKYNFCKCFSCGVIYDIFDLIGIDYGVNTFKEKLEIAKSLYGDLNIEIPFHKETISYENKLIDFSNYYQKCFENINKTDYLKKRRIASNLILKYKIGFDEKKQMIIFPINKNCYFGRGISQNLKLKSRGTSYLWNEEILNNSNNELIYVTESIIDSLSLETINPNVKTIALNGLPNYKRLINLLKENNHNNYFVLAFDNDNAGLTYQTIVKNKLEKINIHSFPITLISSISGVKDLNEALINDEDRLRKNFDYFDENLKIIKDKLNGDEIEI